MYLETGRYEINYFILFQYCFLEHIYNSHKEKEYYNGGCRDADVSTKKSCSGNARELWVKAYKRKDKAISGD